MNHLSRIIVLSFLIMVFAVSGISADDGSWSQSFSIQGGSIYSEEDSSAIALEKELLVFDGEKTRAVFLFKNLTDTEVNITCGFPVVGRIDSRAEGDVLVIPRGKYGGGEIPLLKYFETKRYKNPYPDEPSFANDKVIPMNEVNNRRYFVKETSVPDIQFSITQDGKKVSVSQVLMELKADKSGASVTRHFQHQLSFAPGAESIVVVEYTQDLFHGAAGAGMGSELNWDYIIGTGGTWAGPIGELFITVPSGWYNNMDKIAEEHLSFRRVMKTEGFILYTVENYEPKRDQTFNVFTYTNDYPHDNETVESLKNITATWEKNYNQYLNVLERQVFVHSVSASSYLNGYIDAYGDTMRIIDVPFSADAAFDGLPQTAWCEGVSGNGEGEFLKFRLSRPVWGVTIHNGYTRFPCSDSFFTSKQFFYDLEGKHKNYRDFYTLNSRPRILELQDGSGKVLYTLTLKDQRDAQTLPFVNLEPGEYRLVVKEVYRGSRWEDTCLGEVFFHELSSKRKDYMRFFRGEFYINAMDQIVY